MNNNISLDSLSQNLISINSETKKVLCECSPKQTITSNITKEVFNVTDLKNMVFSINKITNYKILFCYKLLKNIKQYINNYGFDITAIIIICFIIFMIIVFIIGNKQFKQYCYEIIEQRQLFIRTYNIYHNKNVNNIYKKKLKGVKNKKSKNLNEKI